MDTSIGGDFSVVENMEPTKTVKTTINLEEELWKKFSVKVIQEYGGRKKTDVFEALAEAFVNTPNKTITQALEDWIRQEEKRKRERK